MKILFAGNPDIAVPTLKSLLEHPSWEVVGVLVNPDAPIGRSKKLVASPVKALAQERHLRIFDPIKLDESIEKSIDELGCDLLVCFAYGKIFKKSFLSLFPLGGINIHPSLLPKYRGPTPIQAALLAGDYVSGVTIQRLGIKMDAGNILAIKKFDLTQFLHASDVEAYVSRLAGGMITQVLEAIQRNDIDEREQNEDEASYCKLITPLDAKLNIATEFGEVTYNKIRAYNYLPGAYCFYEGKRLFISHSEFVGFAHDETPGKVLTFDKNHGLQVAVLGGYLWLKEIQLEGKKRMDATSFFNGNRAIIGIILD